MWNPSVGRTIRHNCWFCGRFIWGANDMYSCRYDEVVWRKGVTYPNVVYDWDLTPDVVLGWKLAEKIPNIESSSPVTG